MTKKSKSKDKRYEIKEDLFNIEKSKSSGFDKEVIKKRRFCVDAIHEKK